MTASSPPASRSSVSDLTERPSAGPGRPAVDAANASGVEAVAQGVSSPAGAAANAAALPSPATAAPAAALTRVLTAVAPSPMPPEPASAAPTVPRQLGRFSVTRALRREKNSVVYLGLDPVLHREVVIKAVQLPPPSDATAHREAQIDPLEQAFVRQAQAAGKLSHPHIVTVYEAGRVHETGFLAIERVNGRPLHELIASGWRPQFVHCASIAARIADAIAHAHQHGVAHGHLGPQHVVLQADGVPKVEGFGGWIDGGATGDEALARTEKLLPYFHSELTDEERRRDVIAVASLVHMMVTGKAPHGDRPAPVASLRADVPPALARVIDEALAPGAGAKRGVAELRDALTAFIWNERRENIAPATIGIPLAAPPRRDVAGNAGAITHAINPGSSGNLASAVDGAAVASLNANAYAPTVAIDLYEPAAAGSRPASPSGANTRPATLTLRPGTTPSAPLSAELPVTPPPAPSSADRLRDGTREALRWLRDWTLRNRTVVGGVAGLISTAVVIAGILAMTAGPRGNGVPVATATTAATAAPPAVPGNGVVRLDIAPWGEVFVDGKAIGVSPPLTELNLAGGRYSLEIRHGDAAAVTAEIDVDPARPLQVRHRFDGAR